MARENPLLLTTEEAGALIGKSGETVRRWIKKDGTLLGCPVFRTGATDRNIRIPRGRLLQALGMTEDETR